MKIMENQNQCSALCHLEENLSQSLMELYSSTLAGKRVLMRLFSQNQSQFRKHPRENMGVSFPKSRLFAALKDQILDQSQNR